MAAFARLLPHASDTLAILLPLTVLASACIGGSLVLARGLQLAMLRHRNTTGSFSRWTSVVMHALGVVVGSELTLLLAPQSWVEVLHLDGGRWPLWGLGAAAVAVVALVHARLETLRTRARASERLAQMRQERAVEAEMAALQAHTQPHFLFNALSLVSTLIEEDPDQAATALDGLADLLRYIMRSAHTGEVELVQEVDAVRTYLELQSMRFGDRLRYRIDVADDVARSLVLPMSVQPLVENSVRHGVLRRHGGAMVVVRARRVDAQVCIEVLDDGPGSDASADVGSAHANLRHRLHLYYGDGAHFECESRAGRGFAVWLKFPYRERTSGAQVDRVDCR